METALRWCGWEVEADDLKGTPCNPPAGLQDPEVRTRVETRVWKVDAVVVAMDCKSLCRARGAPFRDIGGLPNGCAAKMLSENQRPRKLSATGLHLKVE